MNQAPVPQILRGGWQRSSIRNADGTEDTTSLVVWLQLESLMVDVRFAADQPKLAERGSLANCSVKDMLKLAASESSSGYTTCTPVKTDASGTRHATAEWFTRGYGIAYQPVSANPEPGLLEWNADASVMIERAPSGAYVEEWRRMEDTDGPLEHRVLQDGSHLYVAGSVAVAVRDRPNPVPRAARLQELVAEAGSDKVAVAALVDCQFSLAQRHNGAFAVVASTLPWQIGTELRVDL